MAEEKGKVEKLPLAQAGQHLLEECRMVLPGIQALFGFQLVAVFNEHFSSALDPSEQAVHLAAIALVAVAIALVMAPAAYHRQTGPEQVTEHFLRLSSRLLLASMFPLALGIALDFYLIARLITHRPLLALSLAVALLALYGGLWLVLPSRYRRAAERKAP